jgi:hypothetical protein
MSKEHAVAVNDSRLPTREAAFADAAQAERAVAQLQSQGIDAGRISVERGETTAPGRTAAADREIADRISGSWATGSAIGTVGGAILGAIIGGLVFDLFTPGFWGTTIGVAVAAGGVGALWGMFAGFAASGSGATRRSDTEHRELRDAVRVIVATKPGEDQTVRRILGEQGGAVD